MKKCILVSLLALLLFGTGLQPANAQSEFENAIKQFTGETAKGYLQPFIDAFGNNLNAGLYRTAHVSRLGLHFYVGIIGAFTIIPDDDKTFLATPPPPFPQQPVETATIFGDEGATVNGPGGLVYHFQNGQIQGDVVPFAVPQLEIGSFLGTMVKLRYISVNYGDLPQIRLSGFGIQHSISQYFPLFPIDLSVGYFRQTFEVGDLISASATSIGVQASKSFVLLTLYGTAAYETASMDVSYTYEGGSTPEEVRLELKSDGHIRVAVGARLRLGFLILNADYTVGSQNSASIGLGVGL